jgi:hypothetical protein
LSKLSVWWLKLGIVPERIAPGQPQQNGRHERMHRTLKQETASPPARTVGSQQRAFDLFRAEYNHDRPHEALGDRTPASAYEPSARFYPSRLFPFEYPGHMSSRKVDCTGVFYWQGHRVFLGEALCSERIGLEAVDDGVYRIHLGRLALGFFDAVDLKISPEARVRG